ncbi:MAG: hypothetical protein ACYCVH_06510 [Ignavibacteriaceae bacterium]
MKYAILFSLAFAFVFSACSKKEEIKLEAFSPEAFAYNMGDSSEVDATTRVKGFVQRQENGLYKATIAYDIDLVTPAKDTVKSLLSRVVDRSKNERMSDTPLEAQFNLDSTYKKGNYTLIYRIKDVNSGQTAISTAAFDLGD